MNLASEATTLWAIVTVISIILAGFGVILRYLMRIEKRFTKIDYALWNEGRTGLVQRVEEMHAKQSEMSTDIAVIKSKRSSTRSVATV
jgi:hypothetical protein